VEKVFELELSPAEQEALDESARQVKEGVKNLEEIYIPG
jgi:malate/lactate dehydrogenase